MQALKCDNDGTYFTQNEPGAVCLVVIPIRPKDGPGPRTESLDLCPKCAQLLDVFTGLSKPKPEAPPVVDPKPTTDWFGRPVKPEAAKEQAAIAGIAAEAHHPV